MTAPKDDLEQRIQEALDAGGLELDEVLAERLASDASAAMEARAFERVDRAVRGLAPPTLSEDQWESLASRVVDRLDERLPLMADPTRPPELVDEGEPREPSGRQKTPPYTLDNLSDLEVTPGKKKSSHPPAPLPPRTGERAEIPRVAPRAAGSITIDPLAVPASEPVADIQSARAKRGGGRSPLVFGGLAAAAAVMLAIVGTLTMSGSDEAPSQSVLAPGSAERTIAAAEEVAMPAAPAAIADTRSAGAIGNAEPMGLEMARAEEAAADGLAAPDPAAQPMEGAASGAAGGSAPAATEQSTVTPSRRARGSAGGGVVADEPRQHEKRGGAMPAAPSRQDVLRALQAITPQVRACGRTRHGTAMTTIVVAGSTGRVETATVTGPFAGSPEAACITRAVRGARFPRFSNPTFRIQYPFQL